MKDTYQVIIVGGGFAGVAAAKSLGRKDVDVLLIDVNNYHQFQPLLYQVATAQIGVSEVATPLRAMFHRHPNVRVLTTAVTKIDAATRTVTTVDGGTYHGGKLVIAAGAEPNFFNTPGAQEHAYPLYSVDDAVRLGTTLVNMLDDLDKHPEGPGVNVVVVGAGPTGVETAGAVAENIKYVIPRYFSPEIAAKCSVHLVDMLPNVLSPFSKNLQQYATHRLEKIGVKLKLGQGVSKVTTEGVTFADDTTIPAQIVVWAGGLKAVGLIGESGLPQGRGGRVDVEQDLTAPGFDGVYVLGDAANMTDAKGNKLPQLGSCAQQAGAWAAKNILAELAGEPRKPFEYVDKGYMAMIGRGAAVAEISPKRYQLKGPLAFAAWLGVHAALLPSGSQRVGAVSAWTGNYLTHTRAQVFLTQPEEAAAASQ